MNRLARTTAGCWLCCLVLLVMLVAASAVLPTNLGAAMTQEPARNDACPATECWRVSDPLDPAVGRSSKPTVVNLQVDLVGPEDAESVLPVLELFEAYGWHTTVFVTGKFALANPALVKEIHDRGHQIGVLGEEELLLLSEEELYDRLQNAFLAVRTAVGNMQPQYIADFKLQGYRVNDTLLRVLSRLQVRSCTGVFPDGPDHPHSLERYGLVAIPLAEGVLDGDMSTRGNGVLLVTDNYLQRGLSVQQFFADLHERYDVNRHFYKPLAASLRASVVALSSQLQSLKAFLSYVAETPGYLAVVDQLTALANPFIDWITIEAPAEARAGEEITVTVRYYANCYCPWYYFMIYGCEHGWQCDLPLVRGLFWDPLWAEQQFVHVGEHSFTFETRLPLTTGNYTYRLVAVGQACHGGPCWPTWSETIRAKYDAIASAEVRVTAPPVRLLFVPLNWNATQDAFNSYVTAEVERFITNTPLRNCLNPVYAHKLTVSDHNITNFTGSLDDLRSRANQFVQQIGLSDDLFHVVVGVAPSPPDPKRPNAIGRSNETDTVWIVDDYTYVLVHELGHIDTFGGLLDEYCSHDAGSPSWAPCNSATAAPNPLDANLPTDCPSDGSDDSINIPCCEDPAREWQCEGGYHVCCYGNKIGVDSGRCIMSYAGAPEPRAFCAHCQARLNQMAILTECAGALQALSMGGVMDASSAKVVVLELGVSRDGSVAEHDVGVRPGTTAPLPWPNVSGAYALRIIDINGDTVYEGKFDPFFGYTGPVVPGVDYSNIMYDEFLVSTRIPFIYGMHSVSLLYMDQIIYARTLPVATIRGAVTAAGGAPVAGAAVYARGPGFASARTDDQGRYVIAITEEPGWYSLSVEPADPNIMPAQQALQIELQQVYEVNFTLDLAGSIGGTVTDAAGNPVTEAWIHPVIWEPPYYKVQENGEYLIPHLSPGSHTIAIDAPGYGDWHIYVDGQFAGEGTSVTVNVEAGRTTRVDFTQRGLPTALFFDNLEPPRPGWQANGLWHLANNTSCISPGYTSPTHAWYYGDEGGCNYYGSGALTSPQIPMPEGTKRIFLSFDYFLLMSRLDRAIVQVSFDGGRRWSTVRWYSRSPAQGAWTSTGEIPLSVPRGATSVMLRFSFTTHKRSTGGIGWLIDNISITTPLPLRIIDETLPEAILGQPYSHTMTAEGGTPPYTWSARGLPSGLRINSRTGVISGTPRRVGTYNVTITLRDRDRNSVSKSFILVVLPPIGALEFEPLQVFDLMAAPSPAKKAIKFFAEGTGIKDIGIEVFNLAGARVFDSGWVGNGFSWYLQNNQGQPLANGVYLYVITVRGFDGQVIRSEVRKLVVLR